MTLVERIARVLAGQFYSRNAGGAAGMEPAAELVDGQWLDFVDDAVAVLKTLREPTDDMSAVGDREAWHRMVEHALKREEAITEQGNSQAFLAGA
jgi:hypothetical protein